MANRRMFSQRIVGDDQFLNMPISTQALYFHLGMYADDDGFISPQKVIRMVGANADDLKMLIAKKFCIPFETGVVVITNWKENNYIQKDRYTPTIYQTEAKMLDCIQDVYKLDTQDRVELGKVRTIETLPAKAGKTPSKSFEKVDQFINDRFWPAYPKKVAKADAIKAMRKLDPDGETQEKILANIDVRRKTEEWMKKNGAFIPYPATYIRGRRWEDEIEESQLYQNPQGAVIEN